MKKKDVYNVHKVIRDKNINFVSCICKNFNNKGIPCKHIIALLKKLQVTLLPDAYILKIWTKIAKLEKVVDDDGEEIKDCKDKLLLLRRTKLFHFASEVIDQVVSSEESSQMFIDSLEDLRKKVKSIMISCKNGGVLGKDIFIRQLQFNEPLEVRFKGCGKRLKGRKEKAKEKAKEKGRR